MNTVSLFPIFQSGMVLQREKPICIWGTAPAGSIVTVSLNAYSVDATTDNQGNFNAILPPMQASTDCTLSLSCNASDVQPLILSDICIGDVWLAGGQSNMEFFLRYEKDWDTVKHYEVNPLIRVYNVPQTAFEGHRKPYPGYGRWMQSNDPDFETFSAPAYSFARTVQPEVNVPIGIIGCNWGGTTATAWLDESNLTNEPLNIYLKEYEEACSLYSEEEMKRISLEAWEFEDSPQHDMDFRPLLYGRSYEWQKQYKKVHDGEPVVPMGPYNINRPGGLYHLMLEPLTSFSIKGAIWYQGESDAAHADMYDILLSTLIDAWRQKWNDEFPFYFVQLAPFGVWLGCDSVNYEIVRAKQEKVSLTVPATGMACIMDIGSYEDIHPKQKMEVGRRLGLLALGKTYGKDILCESPRMVKADKSSNVITLEFNNCNTLTFKEGNTDFSVVQNNVEKDILNTSVSANCILLTVKDISDEPLTVSLAYKGYAEVHLYNEAGLPVCPFQITI